MKGWLFILAIIIVAALYGWRFYPQNIPAYFSKGRERLPVFAQESSKNVMSQWKPQDLLDNFNGDKKFREEHPGVDAKY